MTDTTTPSATQVPAAGSSAVKLPEMATTTAAAVEQLAALKSDKQFVDGLMNGAPAFKERFSALHSMIDAETTAGVDLAMAGQFLPGGMNTPEHIERMGLSEVMQGLGLRPELVRAVLSGNAGETLEAKRQVEALRAERHSDKEWVARLHAGDVKARREQLLFSIARSADTVAG